MVLLTGGAGYIGSVAVRELLDRGFAVRVLDRFLYGDYPLAAIRDRIDVVQGDICRLDETVLDGVTGVIHLAGFSNDPTAEVNPEANHRMNTVATRTLAEACKRRGVERFIFGSSCAVYDRGPDAQEDIQDEDSEVEPRAPYATSKFEAERILIDMADDQFRPTILRHGTVYGWSPRMRYDLVVNTFVKSAFQTGALTVHSGGRMWRPVVDVTDAARCYAECLESELDAIGGRIFNVSYENYTVLMIAESVKEALSGIIDVDIKAEDDDRRGRSYRVSTARIETAIGFHPRVSVQDSVRNLAGKVQAGISADFDNPKYYNIKWLELLIEVEQHLKRMGSVF